MNDISSKQPTSWAQFDHRVRFSGGKLLRQLDNYSDPILIAGCQRSGTTALTRLIVGSEEIADFRFGKDDELDAALILSGWQGLHNKGRYCFQTTYLNDSFAEYFEHNNYRLIWVLRKPSSVIYSMLYNWKVAALNRLFLHCGSAYLDGYEKIIYQRIGPIFISRLRRACLSYNAKVSQIFTLHKNIDSEKLFVVDYDRLIAHKDIILPRIYRFIDLPYKRIYSDELHAGSINKASRFQKRYEAMLNRVCMPVYEKACELETLS